MLEMKEKDTLPFIEGTLQSATGPLDLTNVKEVLITSVGQVHKHEIKAGVCTIAADRKSGEIVYEQTEVDTSVADEYEVEYDVIYNDGKHMHVPGAGTVSYKVNPLLA